MQIIKEGYLNKKSQFIGSSRKRWIVLNSKQLQSYKKKQIYTNCTESFDLAVYDVIHYDLIDKKTKTFELISSNKQKEKRTFVAESNNDLLMWVKNIRSVQQNILLQSIPKQHEEKKNQDIETEEKSCSISSDSQPQNNNEFKNGDNNNPYYDKQLMSKLSEFSPTANQEFMTKHDNKTQYEFPIQIETPTESVAFDTLYDSKDLEMEQFLCNKYKTEIQSFSNFCDFTIIRFVKGYRHIEQFSQRLQQTDESFQQYLIWYKTIDFDNSAKMKQLNGLVMYRYMEGCYIYGQDKYGHPIFWDEGSRWHKQADMSIHKVLDNTQKDYVLGYIMGILQAIKAATANYYKLNTKMNFEITEEKKQVEQEFIYKASYSTGVYGKYMLNMDVDEKKDYGVSRKVGIYQHCLIFDVKRLNSKRVLKDRKIHETYAKRAQMLWPEITSKIYVINTPWVFQKVWKIAKSFLDDNTISKTKILGKNYMEELLKDIDINMIPRKYGGKGQWDINYGGVPKNYPIQYLAE